MTGAETIETRWIPLIDGAPKPIPYKRYLFTTEDGEVIETAWDSHNYSKYLAYMEIPEDVLKKIRAEISKLLDSLDANSAWYRLAIKDCLKIIEKARKEQE